MTFKAIGDKICIVPDDVEEVSQGGIVLRAKVDAGDRANIEKGTIRSFGTTAKDLCEELEIGKKILFVRYAGREIKEEEDGTTVRYMELIDILAIEE
jgi:co-chaperonin GroES (HSP10)